MRAVVCHCCGVEVYGASGSCSFPRSNSNPDDIFATPPEIHCPQCTERNLAAHVPCLLARRALVVGANRVTRVFVQEAERNR